MSREQPEPHSSRLPTSFSFTFVRPPDRRSTFEAVLLRADEETIILTHVIQPSKPFTFGGEEVIGPGYRAVWFLFQGKPYDVGRFYRPDGAWTGYYVDVLEPVRWQTAPELRLEPMIDLFLDLWIAPGGEHAVLDQDEFDDAVRARAISPSQADAARATLDELRAGLRARTFPPPVAREMRWDFRPSPAKDPGPWSR